MTISERVMKGWNVKLFNPTQCDLPEEEREVLLEKKFKTIRQAHTEITEILNNYDFKVSYSAHRKIGDGSYTGKNSRLKGCIKFEKCDIKVKHQVIIKQETKIEILN